MAALDSGLIDAPVSCAVIAPVATETRTTSFQPATVVNCATGTAARTVLSRVEAYRTVAPAACSRLIRSLVTEVTATSTSVPPVLDTTTPVWARGRALVVAVLSRSRPATASRLSSLRSAGLSDCLICCRAAIWAAAVVGSPVGAAAGCAAGAALAAEAMDRIRAVTPVTARMDMSRPGRTALIGCPFVGIAYELALKLAKC